jgi:hypothetical protein
MGPDDRDPHVDDWFKPERRAQGREQRSPRRPGLPPPGERRVVSATIAAGAAALLLVVILVVVFTGGDDAPAEDPGAVVPPVTDTEETADPLGADDPPAATPQPFPTNEILRPGDEGERVVALQRALATLGHDPGEPDGVYGPATTEAVRSFQTAGGLPADGIAGPNTLNALNEALAEQG